MSNKKLLQKRYFLNPNGDGVAAASARVALTYRVKRTNARNYPACEVDATLSLSDCNRQIHLEFDLWPSGDRKGMLRDLNARRTKLARLKAVVDEFVTSTLSAYDFVEEHLDEYVAAYAAAKAAEKKEKKK